MTIGQAYLEIHAYELIHKEDDCMEIKGKIATNFLFQGLSYVPVAGFFKDLVIMILFACNQPNEKTLIAVLGIRTVEAIFGPAVLPIVDLACTIIYKRPPRIKTPGL